MMLCLLKKLNAIKLLSVAPWGDTREIIVLASFKIHSHNNPHVCFNACNILGVSNAEPSQRTCVLHIQLIRHNLNILLT